MKSRGIAAEPSLVLLRPKIDRTSDLIRKVYSLHLECYHATVVGWIEPLLCDDHYRARGWRLREDKVPAQGHWSVIEVGSGICD